MALDILPPVHQLLDQLRKDPTLPPVAEIYLKRLVREAVDSFRKEISAQRTRGKSRSNLSDAIVERVSHQARALLKPFPARVINGTGVILHTNLGRAPLGDALSGYSNLEWDAASQKRGNRDAPISDQLRVLTGAGASLAVNNCAAALLLALSSMARNKRVLVSRSELVEIGGGFRIPEILETSGCDLVEVGTTNRTRLADYERKAVRGESVLLKVHQSNFVQRGFVSSVSLAELAALGTRLRIPVIHDVGSGLLRRSAAPALAAEPSVEQSLAAGASIVVFSGDKLLGGVQAGLAVGKRSFIDSMHNHPLYRALRLDKVRLALLHHTFASYIQGSEGNLPVWRFMKEARLEQARSLLRLPEWAQWVKLEAQAGGGSNPESGFESWGLALRHPHHSPGRLKESFAARRIPILGYVRHDAFCIDVRAFFDGDFAELQQALEENRAET